MAEQGSSGGWLQTVIPLITTTANAIGRGGPKRQYKYNKKMANYQNSLNRANAEWAFEKELELRKFQMDYDTPAAQMARYKDAGLNPNLIYGNGSSSAGSFTPPDAPNVPGVSAHQVDASVMGNIGTEFQQARLMAAQTDLTRTRTEESTVKQDLVKAQTEVTKANPYLREGYVSSMVAQLRSTANLKEQEAKFMLETVGGTIGDTTYLQARQRGTVILEQQMDNLLTKFQIDKKRSTNLDEDLKIKAQIFQSKEFQNELSKVQVEWMKNADITPQHIYQAIFMLLQSMMRR